MNNNEISLYSPKILQNEIENVQEANIPEEDKQLILRFGQNCKTRQLSNVRTRKYLFSLKKIAQQMPFFAKATKKELESFLCWLEQQQYSENTKQDYRVTISVFFKWLEAERLGMTIEELQRQRKEPEIISGLRVKAKNQSKKLPEQLLTEEEVLQLIKSARCTRDKAFIAMLFESGARISEIGTLRNKNVTFNEHGTAIKVHGKTGERRMLLISSTEYIKNWLNEHPDPKNPNSPFWIGEQSQKEIKYSMFRKILLQTAKKAGIKKPTNPHHFRHSRATIMAQSLTEQQLKGFFGWAQGSDMASQYVHLSGKNMDDAVLNMYGLKSINQQQAKILPRKCICGQENEPTILFCKKCHAPLTAEAMIFKKEELKTEQENKEKENQLRLKEMECKIEIMYQMMQKMA
jgi:integrase/recombinase XerD